MNIKELNDYIKTYMLHDKANRAILLTAPWGSGKSFYVKNDLVPFLRENDIDSVLVSLYGINRLSELSKNIYLEAKCIRKKSEGRTIGKIVAKTIAKNVAGHFGIDLSVDADTLQKLYESVDLSGKLLILDDLERSGIDIIELLGFINNLCEQDGVKVLLVANEKEIKYENLTTAEKDKEHITDNTPKKKSESYIRIKEKTIGDTIIFMEDRDHVVSGILSIFDNDYFKRWLTKSPKESYNIISKVIKVMDLNKSHNYRSFLYACQKTNDIIRKLNKREYNDEFIENLFLGTVAYLTKTVSNNSWQGDGFTSKELGLYAYPLYWVMYEYINFQQFDETMLQHMEALFLKAQKISELDDYLQKIYHCVECSEKEVIEAIDKLENGLSNNILPDSDYITIANYLIFLKDIIQYDKKIDNCLNLMINNAANLAKKGQKITTESFSGIQLETQDERDALNAFIQKIKEVANQRFVIDENDYSAKGLTSFYDKIEKERSGFINYGGFAKHLDIDKLLQQLKVSSSKEISDIRGVFLAVYRSFSNINQYFQDDIENLKLLLDGVNKIIEDPETLDLIQQKQLQWFSSNISEILERLV